jgi:anaerobic selenocysteine-containing dehydrogenase
MIPTRSRWGIGKLKRAARKVIGVNPIRTGYNAVADEWVGITPGTDGLFILSLIHELCRGQVDLDYLRATPTRGLVVDDPASPEHGLFPARRGRQAAGDRPATGKPAPSTPAGPIKPTCHAADGHKGARTVFQLMARKYLDRRIRARGRRRARAA